MFFNAFIMICNALATFCSRDIKTFDMITQRNRKDFPSNSRTVFIHPANISLVLLNRVKRSVNLITVFAQNLEEIRQSKTLFPQGGITSEIWLTANTELKRNKRNRNIPCIIFLAAFLLFPVECTSQTRRRHRGDRDSILSCTYRWITTNLIHWIKLEHVLYKFVMLSKELLSLSTWLCYTGYQFLQQRICWHNNLI